MDIYEDNICLFKRVWYKKFKSVENSDTKVTQFPQQKNIYR